MKTKEAQSNFKLVYFKKGKYNKKKLFQMSDSLVYLYQFNERYYIFSVNIWRYKKQKILSKSKQNCVFTI